MGIEAPAYQQVAGVLREEKALLRTSGAGAGDSAWLVARSHEELAPALAALEKAGYRLLDVGVGGRGLVIEEGPE